MCNSLGGHLAVPLNAEEHENIQEFLTETLGNPNVDLQARLLDQKNKFKT